MQVHDNHAAEENCQRLRKKLEKQVEAAETVLTDWDALKEKRRKTAEAKGLSVDDPSLWMFLTTNAFTVAERKVILHVCAPDSGVLSKGEGEHIDIFRKENVTYLKILAAVEGKKIKLTNLKKHLADIGSDQEPSQSDLASVEDNDIDYDIQLNNEDEGLLQMSIA